MPELSTLAVFLGGVLSILSPCSALLLPAFFAVAFTSPARLLGQALLFYAGLATIFVPLGAGVSAVAGLFIEQREVMIVVAGLLLIGFGAVILVGGGLDLAPNLAGRLHTVQGPLAAYATGLAYGFAGFCTGPILGGVLTVAGASGQAIAGAALLAVYALGMTVPVFALALVWDRCAIGQRHWLRDAVVQLGRARLPVSRLLASSLFALLGILFIAFQGSSALSGAYADLGLADLTLNLEEVLLRLDPRASWLLIAAVGIGLSLAAARRSRRPPPSRQGPPLAARGASQPILIEDLDASGSCAHEAGALPASDGARHTLAR